MKPHVCPCLVAGSLLVSLLLAIPQPVSATIVFDDHFTGNSGGIPADWWGQGVIVEAGTTVTLHNFAFMATTPTIDPQAGIVTVTVDIVGTNYRAHAGIVDPVTHQNQFEFKITLPNGDVDVRVKDATGGDQGYYAGRLTGYTGEPIRLTAVLTATTFTISTDSPAFSTGPIEYAVVFPTFTRAALGNAAALLLVCEALEGSSTHTTYDRVTADIEQEVPTEPTTFGAVKALYRH